MMKKYIVLLSVLFTAFLAACSQPPTVAVPKSPIHQIVGVTASITPTLTATKHKTRTFTPSPTATATFTPLPTSTPNPNPTIPPALESTPFNVPSQPITLVNVSEIVELARWGNGQILDVRYSPDGTVLAVATTAGQRIFNGTTLEELPFSAELWETAFPANEVKPEIVLTEKGYELWKSGIFTIEIERSKEVGYLVEPFKFSADKMFIAAETKFTNVGLWDGNSGKLLHTFIPDLTTLSTSDSEQIPCGGINSITFSANSKFLAASCYEGGGVFIWDIASRTQVFAFSSNNYFVKGLAFSPDNSLLAGVILGGDACVWKTSTGELYACFSDSHISFYAEGARLFFSPNGRHLVGIFDNGEVLVWHFGNQRLLKRLFSSAPSGSSVAFSPDSSYLAASAFRDVSVWQIATGRPLEFSRGTTAKRASIAQSFTWLSGPPGYIEFVAFSPNGNAIIYANDDGQLFIRAMSPNAQPEIVEPEEHDIIAYALLFNSDGEIIFPDELSIYQDLSLTVLSTYDAISPDREFIAEFYDSPAEGPKLRVIHLSDGRITWSTKGAPYDITFSPDGYQLAASIDDQVQIWHVGEWTLTHKLSLDSKVRLSDVTYSPDGEILATGGSDGKIYLWEAKSGNFLRTLESHTIRIGDLAFSPDGKLLASTSADGTVRLWGIP